MLKIQTSLDWANTETEIQKLGNLLPAFRHDIKKILESIRPEVTKLGNLEVEDRRMHNSATRRRCQQQVDLTNERLKLFAKFHLMAVLAQ